MPSEPRCADSRPAANAEVAVTSILWVLVAGLIALYGVVFVCIAASRVVRPLEEFSYGESWLLDGARRVAEGGPLYAPADRLPLMHFAYTPIYYLLVGGLLRVFGDGGYTIGRLVSAAATLVGCAALAWTMRALTGRWRIGLLAAGLFLTQNATALLWGSLHRVDALALAFTLVGLALATANRVYAASVLFVLALLTKQTFLVAPVAVCCSMWPCRGRMVRFAACVLGLSAAAVAVLEWLSGGWFLWHIVTANTNEADLDTFAILMGSFLQFNGLTVLGALVTLIVKAERRELVWRVYFLGCLALLPTIAKIGASSNYWLELTAATGALLALGAHRVTHAPGLRVLVPALVAGALMVAVPAYQASTVEVADTFRDLLQPPSPRYLSLISDTSNAPYRVQAQFVQHIAHEPGELLTDNPGLAVAAGKRIAFEFQIFQLLHVEGRWSEQPILDAIVARRFALVALMHPLDGPIDGTRLTPAVRDALVSAYVPDTPQAGFWLYRPR